MAGEVFPQLMADRLTEKKWMFVGRFSSILLDLVSCSTFYMRAHPDGRQEEGDRKLCVFIRKLKCLSSILFSLKWKNEEEQELLP